MPCDMFGAANLLTVPGSCTDRPNAIWMKLARPDPLSDLWDTMTIVSWCFLLQNNNISSWHEELLGGLLVLDTGVLGLSFPNFDYQYLGSPTGSSASIDVPRARLELLYYTPRGRMADATLTCCRCCYPANTLGRRRGVPLVSLKPIHWHLPVSSELIDPWFPY